MDSGTDQGLTKM